MKKWKWKQKVEMELEVEMEMEPDVEEHFFPEWRGCASIHQEEQEALSGEKARARHSTPSSQAAV